jgi:hypothetical protein
VTESLPPEDPRDVLIREQAGQIAALTTLVAGRLTSDDVTQNRLDIRGYIDTTRKHGLGACEILRQLITGSPRLPPAQPISP